MLNTTNLPEVLFSTSDKNLSKQINKLEKEGIIRKIATRVYTPNLIESPERIVRKNFLTIIGVLYPEALLSHRSALEIQPTQNGNLYLTYSYTKNIKLPGITLKFLKGRERLESDNRLNGELYFSSLERACLENFQQSRKSKDGELRTADPSVIEKRLIGILQANGEDGLNQLRDKARELALELGMEKEFERFNKKIGALLSTKPTNLLQSPLAVAAALGMPYDAHRVELFWKLFTTLNSTPMKSREERFSSIEAKMNFAFFEAYFSNYIEGTEFEVQEAKQIVFDDLFIENRTGDSHDIKGTYEIVGNGYEMQKTPTDYKSLIELLTQRHAIIMRGRPDKLPGSFKQKANRAGNTTFVEPHLVRGTLKQAIEPYQALEHPLAKAIFIMFAISEIHPFADGNGRIARVMMNAELQTAGHCKIIVPTAYREDYLLALRKLTRQQIPDAYIRMLDRAQAFSHWLNADDYDAMLAQLNESKAFLEPSEGKLTWPLGN